MIRTLTLAALAAALVAQTAYAQRTAAPSARPKGTAVPPARAQATAGQAAVNDSLFAAAASVGGVAEVSLSQLGVQKATDPELKKFSQQMIEDHTRMNGELVSMAAQKRVALPRTVDARAQFC